MKGRNRWLNIDPIETKPAIEIKKYDHGTVWALSKALREMVSRYPTQQLLDKCDDDQMSGTRPAPVTRTATIGEVRRWRETLDTYGIPKHSGGDEGKQPQ